MIKEILTNYFGKAKFRDKQESVINNLLAGKNTLCLMPTGMGKSIIYHVTGIAQNNITIVFSPLLALMGQQVKNINQLQKDVIAFSYNRVSGNQKKQTKELIDFFRLKGSRFLYLSPEKAFYDGFLEHLMSKYKDEIGLIVIDEAHCVSQWGYNFRPTYKFIPQIIKSALGANHKAPMLCLTATISPKDAEEICRDFSIEKEDVISSDSLIRKNLDLIIFDKFSSNAEKKDELTVILERHKNEKCIVYAHIKKRDYGTRKLAEEFKALGFKCVPFDADLESEQKAKTMEDFINGDINIIFATSAFGMGIDIPDIRVVVHYLIPESLEQYYQEIGRAGRDNKPAKGYLLYTEANFKIRQDLIKSDCLNAVEAKEIFEGKINTLKSKDGTPATMGFSMSDASDDVKSFSIFLYLVNEGYIKLISKGFSKLDAFSPVNHFPEWEIYFEATSIKTTVLTAKKLGIPLTKIHSDLNLWLFQHQLNPIRVMDNVLNYQIVKMPDSQIFAVLLAQNHRSIELRLANFNKMNELVTNHSENPEFFIEQNIFKS